MRLTAAGGAGSIVLGATLLALIEPTDGYWFPVLPAMVTFGAGVGAAVVPLNLAIMASADPADHGIAAGVLQTAQQVGGALGLAVLTGVFTVGAHPVNTPEGFTAGATLAFAGAAVIALAAVALAVACLPRAPDATGMNRPVNAASQS